MARSALDNLAHSAMSIVVYCALWPVVHLTIWPVVYSAAWPVGRSALCSVVKFAQFGTFTGGLKMNTIAKSHLGLFYMQNP